MLSLSSAFPPPPLAATQCNLPSADLQYLIVLVSPARRCRFFGPGPIVHPEVLGSGWDNVDAERWYGTLSRQRGCGQCDALLRVILKPWSSQGYPYLSLPVRICNEHAPPIISAGIGLARSLSGGAYEAAHRDVLLVLCGGGVIPTAVCVDATLLCLADFADVLVQPRMLSVTRSAIILFPLCPDIACVGTSCIIADISDEIVWLASAYSFTILISVSPPPGAHFTAGYHSAPSFPAIQDFIPGKCRKKSRRHPESCIGSTDSELSSGRTVARSVTGTPNFASNFIPAAAVGKAPSTDFTHFRVEDITTSIGGGLEHEAATRIRQKINADVAGSRHLTIFHRRSNVERSFSANFKTSLVMLLTVAATEAAILVYRFFINLARVNHDPGMRPLFAPLGLFRAIIPTGWGNAGLKWVWEWRKTRTTAAYRSIYKKRKRKRIYIDCRVMAADALSNTSAKIGGHSGRHQLGISGLYDKLHSGNSAFWVQMGILFNIDAYTAYGRRAEVQKWSFRDVGLLRHAPNSYRAQDLGRQQLGCQSRGNDLQFRQNHEPPWKMLASFMKRFMETRRTELNEMTDDDGQRGDLYSRLVSAMDAYDTSEVVLTKGKVTTQLGSNLALMFAGRKMTACALVAPLGFLAIHQEEQQTAYAEIMATVPPTVNNDTFVWYTANHWHVSGGSLVIRRQCDRLRLTASCPCSSGIGSWMCPFDMGKSDLNMRTACGRHSCGKLLERVRPSERRTYAAPRFVPQPPYIQSRL
ncbi:hypothetical protein DFH09DRAFT_1432825 [Mycena vulgaris]|nr:hypothetical protein DFH09DRAFT_1432825 [Mycena vulgaris]